MPLVLWCDSLVYLISQSNISQYDWKEAYLLESSFNKQP